MGLMDKVKQLLGQHGDQANDAAEEAGDAVDERTGGKHASQVDTAQAKAEDYLDKASDPDQAPPE